MSATDRQQEFTELLRQHHSRLFGFILALVRNRDAAHDVLQETCVTLWEKFDSYDRSSAFTSWAFAVARFKVLGYIDRQRRSHQHFSNALLDELMTLQAAVREDESRWRWEALSKCIEKLRPPQQELLWSCYAGTDAIQKVAAELRRSPQSVSNSLRSIREKLLDCVDRFAAQEDR